MYIPVKVKEYKITLVSANKIKELKQYLPCKEALQIHMRIQHIELEKDASYKPKPLYITIGKEIFKDLIEKISGKTLHQYKDHIPLVLQYPSIPICIIQPMIEDERHNI